MRRLRLSKEARLDLEEAWLYIAGESSPARADSVLEDIERRFRLLFKYPEAGRERNELRQGLRSIAASSHAVYYELGAETIDVVRVLHGARDVEAEFRGGE